MHHLIVGLGETEEEMLQTIKLSKEIPLDFATYSLLIPLPGTEDYENGGENDCSPEFNDACSNCGAENVSRIIAPQTPAEKYTSDQFPHEPALFNRLN